MKKVNQLPKGYDTWLQFVVANKEIIREYSRVKYDTPEFCAIPGWGDKDKPIEVIEINTDFAKARAFEELIQAMPDENAIQFALYCLQSHPTNPPQADLSAIENMLIKINNAIF